MFTSTAVVETFHAAAVTWGDPQSVLSDIGAVFTAASRGGVNAFVRQHVVDSGGTVTIRYLGKLRQVGIGRAHKGTRVLLFVAGADVRVVTLDGELLRTFSIDPTKDYQSQ